VSELTVRTSAGSYDVLIGEDALRLALPDASIALIDAAVTDSARIPDGVPTIPVEASESLKTLAGCEEITLALRAAGATRGSCLLAIGGGCVQDAATLVASLYMRGIPWIYAPTTLMAILDSCIGGKSSINVGATKNLIGNIYPPQSVRIDPAFTETLTPEMVVSGLAEGVKICFAGGPEAFHRFLELAPVPGEATVGTELIEHVLGVKRWFIEIDEFDRGERRLLNFGHTFGHALEAAVGFSIPHGVAVALGVRAAIRHPASDAGSLVAELDDYCARLLEGIAPVVDGARSRFDEGTFTTAFAGDKKHSADTFTLVLPRSADDGPTLHLVARPRSADESQLALSCVVDVLDQT
jgi:3-dehydroquinate synthase